jgi:hypothetical protein
LSGVHGLRPVPNRTKIDGRASAPSTLNADATRSGAINDPEEASRRKQSTASVAAHARRRTPYMGACGLNFQGSETARSSSIPFLQCPN